ncbi:MAG: hypothetical protein DRO73_08035 [Candidatus Thorarchaeota archaeon]|nr:MAG: hypothetical protein DRO73_08035 [Candidatus Thorarchaeota archaeon]
MGLSRGASFGGLAVLVISDHCQSSMCQLECIDACKRVMGEQVAITIDPAGVATIDQALCIDCLVCVRACPLGAIHVVNGSSTVDRPRARRKRHHAQRPYETSDTLRPFPESKTIFARAIFDETFEYYQSREYSGAERVMQKHVPGYERFCHELGAAAWAPHDTLRDRHGYIEQARECIRSSRTRPRATPEELTTMVKRAARFFGADLVGVAELDRRWLYDGDRSGRPHDVPEEIDRAVVMIIGMDYDAVATSPTFTASSEVARCYSMITFLETGLAEFIKRLGFAAIPCGNDISLSVPLAIDAGLGQFGRHGLPITKEFGPQVRIAKVLTDMPLVPDEPCLKFCRSVIRFCEVCEKCAEMRPSQSIQYGKERSWAGNTISNNPGAKKWYINPETCYGFWMQNGADCSNCIRSCPYNKPNNFLHRFVLWLTQNAP